MASEKKVAVYLFRDTPPLVYFKRLDWSGSINGEEFPNRHLRIRTKHYSQKQNSKNYRFSGIELKFIPFRLNQQRMTPLF